MTVDIYDAVVKNIPELLELIEAALLNLHGQDALKMIKQMMERVYTAESFTKALDSDNRKIIIAIVKDTIVGMCQYGIPIMDDCDCEDLRSIQMLFVHPDAEHDEIASALIYDVEESINDEAGVQRLSVFVNPKIKSLIKFYASLDFYHDQVEDVDGEWYMEKDI